LRKDEVECPVGECGSGISEGSNLNREDLGRVDPRDDTQWSVEEREDKVHGYHSTKHVAVTRIQVLRHSGVTNKSGSETCSGDNKRLDTTETLECP